MKDRKHIILREFKVRTTPVRESILGLFLQREFAISHLDIDEEISEPLDRITVYRTLKTFLTKGIIHQVPDDKGILKYALCSDACTPSSHRHDHVHFKCIKCCQTNCLDVSVPFISLPPGYAVNDTAVLIQGLCKYCT